RRRRTLGRDHRQEFADVDPCLQAGDPDGHGGLAGEGDDRPARVPGGEGHGRLAGLYRGTEGVFGEACAEMAGKVTSSSWPGLSRPSTSLCVVRTSWMPGSSPGMTTEC